MHSSSKTQTYYMLLTNRWSPNVFLKYVSLFRIKYLFKFYFWKKRFNCNGKSLFCDIFSQ